MEDIKIYIGLITVLLGFIAYIAYIKDILKGSTKPHIFTWFIWTSMTYAIFILQITNGAGPGAWVTLAVALITSTICILSIKHGVGDIKNSDYIFLCVAIFAFILWLGVDEPAFSMILMVTAGISGYVPTIRKSWNQPFTETVSTYAINTLRHGLSFTALSQYTILTALFPAAWTLANGLFLLMLLYRRHVLKNKSKLF